jgi:hypothetical protein
MKFSLDAKEADLSSPKVILLIKAAGNLLSKEEFVASVAKKIKDHAKSAEFLSSREIATLETLIYLEYAFLALTTHVTLVTQNPEFNKDFIEAYKKFLHYLKSAETSEPYLNTVGDTELLNFLNAEEKLILARVKKAFVYLDEKSAPESAFTDKVTSVINSWRDLNDSKIKEGKPVITFMAYSEKVLSQAITVSGKTIGTPEKFEEYRTTTFVSVLIPKAEGTKAALEIEVPPSSVPVLAQSANTWWHYFSTLLSPTADSTPRRTICVIQ